jgi:O-antigen/teichoic acid export membrane protein
MPIAFLFKSHNMENDLRLKTVRALSHVGVGSAVSKVVSLGSTLILARLLSPADYGSMALAMVIITFIGFFNEVGIGSAIVQRDKLTASEVNGCFAIAIFAGITLFIATALLSNLIGNAFGDPQLQSMVSVLAVAFVLGAVSTVPQAILRKEMQFKVIAGTTIVSVIVQSVVSLGAAATGHGAWSLVYGFLAGSSIQTFAYLMLSPWRPKAPYGIREAASLVSYGLHVTSTRIFWYIYTNSDKVIIGKLLGTAPLGIYDMAFSLATLPSSQVTSLVTNVASPLFSKLQNDLPRLRSAILKLTRAVAYVTYPALIGMLVSSGELVAVVLGSKWIDILIPFGALCLLGLIKSVDPLLSQVLIGTGHAKKLSVYTALCGVVMSTAVTVGAILDGLRGVSIAWVVVYPILSVKLLHDTCQVTGMKMREYYRSLFPALAGSLAMGITVLFVREVCLYLSISTPLVLFTEISTGVVVYFLWIINVDRQGINEIRRVMIDLGISENRLNRWPFVRKAI